MSAPAKSSVVFLYVGSFVMPNPPEHEGLHVLRVDLDTGETTRIASYVRGLNVGSFAFDTSRGILYVTDEVANNAECPGGRIYAFSVDAVTGSLAEIGHWPSFGSQPAGITLDASGSLLLVSHFTSRSKVFTVAGDAQSGYQMRTSYSDAITTLFPIDDNGHLGAPCDIHVHASAEPSNSEPSCLHSISISQDGSFFVECDMAKDQLITFIVDAASRSLRQYAVHHAPTGSGPRYSAFHPTLPIFYVNYEYRPVVEAFAYSEGGSFNSIGTVDVLPPSLQSGPGILLSDLRVHPSGRYVYTLVRGHNVISAFSVNTATGCLERFQTLALEGLSPKGCVPSPDGRFLYIAFSVSNMVGVLNVGDDGQLMLTEQTINVPRPSALAVVGST